MRSSFLAVTATIERVFQESRARRCPTSRAIDPVRVALRVICAAVVIGACSPSNSTLTVDGVRLVPADPGLHGSCLRAAKAGGFAVPCPRLILEHRQPTAESCLAEDEPYAGGKDCLEDSAAGNPTAPSRRDAFVFIQNDIVASDVIHLFVVGVKDDSRLAPFRAGCVGPETTEVGPALDGQPSEWVMCPGGNAMNSGHVLLRWHRDGVIYAISLHYQTERNREIELAIARAIEYIGP